MEADREPRRKAQLTLKQILDNTEKVLKGELKQDRDVKIRSVRPYAGTKWVRFDGRATGAENKAYELTLIFYNVDFASERDTKHTIPVAVKGLGQATDAVWMEPLRVDKHPAAVWCSCASFQFRCFTGDTLVPLADGYSVPIRDLVGKEFYVYSYDTESESIVIAKAQSCKCTGRKQKVVKVTFDNGRSVKCTPDHLFMLKDGTFKEAKNLSPGISLKPLYRRTEKVGSTDYEVCLDGKSYWFTHVLADLYNYRHKLATYMPEAVKGFVRHHRDFCPRNNSPTNIRRMGGKAHFKLHSDRMKIANPMKRPEVVVKNKKTQRKHGNYEKTSLRMQMNNPMKRLDVSRRQGKTLSERWLREGSPIKGKHLRPEIRAKYSCIRKKLIAEGKICPSTANANISVRKRVREGTWHFQTEEHRECMRKQEQRKADLGVHAFQNPLHRQKTRERNRRMFKEGTSPFNVINYNRWKLQISKIFSLIRDAGYIPSLKMYSRFRNQVYNAPLVDRMISKGLILSFKDLFRVDEQVRNRKTIFDLQDAKNHKVVSVEDAGYQDIYDFEVPEFHNFAIDVDGGVDLSSGVFVHNSEWYLKKVGCLAAGRKPRPYTKKTTTRKSVNPKQLPGACKHLYVAALKMRAQGYLK